MAVTQYIGSRYVPLFADPAEWSSDNTYEPLTIVLHEGNSYTSKQAVPKDIDIDNETYWALTGNYNAQVEQYRRETEEVKDKIEDLQSAFVIPAQFGASGDGSRNDTAAFESMFAYAESNNATVVIPNGTYILSRFFFVDESTVMVNDGTFPSKSVIVSKLNSSLHAPNFTYDTILTVNQTEIISNGRSMQASCYDSSRNRFVVAFVAGDTDGAYLMAVDSDFDGENPIIANDISGISSHFNDLTYNAKTDTIYTPARPTENLVYAINPRTLNIVRSISVDFGGIIKRFAYDDVNNIYYASGDDYIRVYDESFNLISDSISTDIYDLSDSTDVPVDNIIRQSSFTYNGQFYMMWNEVTQDDNNFLRNWVTQFNYETGEIKHSFSFPTLTGFDECESLCIAGNKLYALSSQGRKNPVMCADVAKNGGGLSTPYAIKSIKSNTDMNDLIIAGTYVCQNAQISATLANCPFSGAAFTLYVLPYSTGNYIFQVYISIYGSVYTRRYRHDQGNWQYLGENISAGRIGGLDNSYYGYEDYQHNQLIGHISTGIGVISNWTAAGSMFMSDEMTIPLPSFDGTNITHYSFVGEVGASNAFGFVTAVRVSGTDVIFRVFSPTQNTTSSWTLRGFLMFTYS